MARERRIGVSAGAGKATTDEEDGCRRGCGRM